MLKADKPLDTVTMLSDPILLPKAQPFSLITELELSLAANSHMVASGRRMLS